MSHLQSPKFLASENGKLLQSVLEGSKNETTKVPTKKMYLTEDVVILREMHGVSALKRDEAYFKVSKMIKFKVDEVRKRHEYLLKNNASIIMNHDNTVKKVNIPGVKYRKIKREVDSKFIDAIEVRADVLESLFEKNGPATVLAITKVVAALSEDERKMFLWEIIKRNKDESLEIMTNFLGDELFDHTGE